MRKISLPPKIFLLIIFISALALTSPALATEFYFIDAHSQMDKSVDQKTISKTNGPGRGLPHHPGGPEGQQSKRHSSIRQCVPGKNHSSGHHQDVWIQIKRQSAFGTGLGNVTATKNY